MCTAVVPADQAQTVQASIVSVSAWGWSSSLVRVSDRAPTRLLAAWTSAIDHEEEIALMNRRLIVAFLLGAALLAGVVGGFVVALHLPF